MRNKFSCIIFFLIVFILLLPVPVSAQEEYVSPGPITSVDLGTASLHLQPGETYTFQVKFEPEDTILTALDWYVTDERVVKVDPLTNTITALSAGEARIFAESFDQFAYAVCIVTVGDSVSKDASVMKSGNDYMGLSAEEMKKIKAESLTRYMDFLADSVMDDASYINSASRLFDVIAAVKPGTEEEQSQLAKDCGIEESDPLKELNAVTLYGSLDAILRYVKDNEDLEEIFQFGPFVADDPYMDEVSSESIQKSVGLKGYTQELTNISYAHKMGLNGKGRWIAVIDSGINRKNAQFTNSGRTIIEACFSGAKTYNSFSLRSVCSNGSKSNGSSAPSLAWNKNEMNHGSHVTGIAAGRDGIAPLANIISIQSHAEKVWTCTNSKEKKAYSCGKSHGNQCCKSYISNSDLGKAYDYVLELSKTRKIDAVNMSYGTQEKYSTACDSQNQFEKKYYDKMRAAGILPIVSSGNNSYNEAVGNPACLSNAYTVGALHNQAAPVIADYSNHSKKVDIVAPGTKIYSAGYSKNMMYMSGTSMATPMVTGAVALVKQMYPGMTPADAGEYLKSISQKSVGKRVDSKTPFKYSKPVLSFGFVHKLEVPYYNWITGGNNSITIKVYRMAQKNVKFSADVTTLNGTKVKNYQVKTKSQGDFTYIRLSGKGLENGHIYKVKLNRSFNIGGVNYWSSTTEYGRPYDGVQSPTINIQNKGVSVKGTGNNGVRYKIYDSVTGESIRENNVPNASTLTTYSGLVNGRLYFLTAAPYRTIKITKNGSQKNINFYGTESERFPIVPMSAPFDLKLSYTVDSKTSHISCSADSAADGIVVEYRAKNSTDPYTEGCTSKNGVFSCAVNVGREYDFRVMKYKIINGTTYVGPIAEIEGRKK